MAQALLEFETLSGEEVRNLIAGQRPQRDNPDEPAYRVSPVPTAGKGRPKPGSDVGLEPQPQA